MTYKLLRGVLVTVVALACWASPASAEQICDGREATIVSNQEGSEVNGTSQDDVIVVNSTERTGFTIRGFGGDDRICGSAVRDVIYGGDGADTIFASRNGDRGWDRNLVYGGEGDDHIVGASHRDGLYGEEGSDLLRGDGGADSLRGGPGPDHLEGGAQPDSLWGEQGDDFVNAGENGAAIHGDPGADVYRSRSPSRRRQLSTLVYTASSSGIVADLSTGKVTGDATGKDTLEGRFHVNGSYHDDVIVGSDYRERITAYAGSDHVSAGGGDDQVSLYEKNSSSSEDSVLGGPGTDLLKIHRQEAFTLDIATGASEGAGLELLEGFENVSAQAKSGPITLTGDEGANSLTAESYSGDGADELSGAGGNDVIRFDVDRMGGGDATPNVAYGGDGDDSIFGRSRNDRLEGNADNDQIWGSGYVIGGQGDDVLHGDSSHDVIEGNEGDDEIHGEGQDDTLQGGAGNDQIFGGPGPNDHLDGGDDIDLLNGGTGVWHETENDVCLNGEQLAECEHTTQT